MGDVKSAQIAEFEEDLFHLYSQYGFLFPYQLPAIFVAKQLVQHMEWLHTMATEFNTMRHYIPNEEIDKVIGGLKLTKNIKAEQYFGETEARICCITGKAFLIKKRMLSYFLDGKPVSPLVANRAGFELLDKNNQ